jgi:SOS-response transcriptional repressor LexA
VDGAVTAKILRKKGDRYFLAPANKQEAFPDIVNGKTIVSQRATQYIATLRLE